MIDIIFAVFILALFVLGYIHGFIKEFFKLVAVVLGLYLSVIYHGLFTIPIEKAIKVSYIFANLLSFLLMFIIIYVIINLISFLAQGASRKMRLTGLDRVIGAFFGFFKAVFLIVVISIILRSLPLLNNFSNYLMHKSIIYKTTCVITQNLRLQKDILRSIR